MKKYGGWLVVLCAVLTACATPSSSIEQQGTVYRIVVPTTALFLEFPADGLKVEQADDSRPYYFLADGRTGLNVSFNFEPATECRNSEACRDYFVRKLKAGYPTKKNWRSSRAGDVFISENMDGPVGGFDLKQQHMNAHFVKEGVWIDVHLSKVQYREADRALFLNFVRSIHFRPKT